MNDLIINHEIDRAWRKFYHSYLALHYRECLICPIVKQKRKAEKK